MNFIELLIRRPVFATVMTIIILMVGAADYFAKRGFKILWLFPVVAILMNLYNLVSYFPYDINNY